MDETPLFDPNPILVRRPVHPIRRAGGWGLFAVLVLLTTLAACSDSDNGDESSKINGSIHVPAGKPPGAVSTVNGSIHIDDNAAITGASTVNGGIQLGDHASATSMSSVNGSIAVGDGAHLSEGASSVNGALTVGTGADVAASLANVNGKITVTAAHVGGGIKTVNGSISITGASRVEGGILVQKPATELLQIVHTIPTIVIGPGATVQGELRFERAVKLYVSDKATIGSVTGATAVPFSGDNPPE